GAAMSASIAAIPSAVSGTPAAVQREPALYPEPPMAAGAYVPNPRLATTSMSTGASMTGGSLTSVVADLLADGLSDRAIARQLHIGLEEVRMARMRVGR